MIKIQDVNFRYPDGTAALENINAEFPPEHIFAVLGESGSGKTTLLNCIGRFAAPQTGEITLDGQSIYELPEREFRLQIGIVFQRLNLFPHMTVLENMMLAPQKVLNKSHKQAHRESYEMLERLGIADLAENYPAQISGGQAQRAAIARGLVLQPEYMLLDEPTSALDANTTDDFAEWLVELKEQTNFVIVTHDLLFARKVATHGVFLSNGKVCDTGKIDSIIDHLQNQPSKKE